MEIENYLDEKERKGEIVSSSKKRLSSELRVFKRWLSINKIYSYQEIELSDINRYLRQKRFSPLTKTNKISMLKGFFKYLKSEGYFLIDPSKDLAAKRKDYLPRFTPSQDEVKEILDELVLSMKFPKRNRAILELIYGTGLRKSEVQRLNVSDILTDEIRVLGKGSKERIVPLGEKTKSVILDYIEFERDQVSNNRALFLSGLGSRLSLSGYQTIVPKEFDKRLTLHSFRHAFATHMLENGASIRHLQKMLGHERLSTTTIYTRVVDKKLREVQQKFHPRG